MSVCFFVNADQGASAGDEDDGRDEGNEDVTALDGTPQIMEHFWSKVTDDIRNVTAEDFKTQALPLARIKKIMKLDEDVKMISAEAPVLFAKAAEIFIHELTLRAWQHTEDNKRRTLQRNDIAMAISKSDQFDFLIDIVPRHEVKPHKPHELVRTQHTHTEQVSQPQHATTLHTQPQLVLQPTAQIVQQAQHTAATTSATAAVPSQPVLLQQVVAPDNSVQNLPIQLTPAQINMIRMQLQNHPNQPIIIQTQQNPTPQIIQVSSQGQVQQQPQQVFLTQVTTSQDDS